MNRAVASVCLLSMVAWMGCSSTPPKAQDTPLSGMDSVGEKMVWSSEASRPGWTVNEPEDEGGMLSFVGVSGKHAVEQGAREDAMRTARKSVVQYLGTEVYDEFEKIKASFGLSSEIVNPSNAKRNVENQVAQAAAKRVKAKKFYLERWLEEDTKRQYWKAYAWTRVAQQFIDGVLEDAVDDQVQKLRKAKDAENNVRAKAQFEDAMKAFENFKARGMSKN